MHVALLAVLFIGFAILLGLVIRFWQWRVQSDVEQHILTTARDAQNKRESHD